MVLNKLKERVRDWLLTEEEQQIVSRVNELERSVDSVKADWSELHRAMEDAEIVGQRSVDEADILVVTGRNHLIQGGEYGKPLYVNGRGIQVTNNRFRAYNNDNEANHGN